MSEYEILLAISEELTEENQKKLVKEISESIEKNSGAVTQTDAWGKRALAFPIEKNKNAYYWLLNFEGQETLPEKLSRQLRINDSVLRYLTTKRVSKKKAKAKRRP